MFSDILASVTGSQSWFKKNERISLETEEKLKDKPADFIQSQVLRIETTKCTLPPHIRRIFYPDVSRRQRRPSRATAPSLSQSHSSLLSVVPQY